MERIRRTALLLIVTALPAAYAYAAVTPRFGAQLSAPACAPLALRASGSAVSANRAAVAMMAPSSRDFSSMKRADEPLDEEVRAGLLCFSPLSSCLSLTLHSSHDLTPYHVATFTHRCLAFSWQWAR